MRMKRKKVEQISFSEKGLRDDVLESAVAIGIPEGTAGAIAEKVAARTAVWVATRAVITSDDLYRRVAQEAEKYSADLAYVYQNRGKII